MQVNLWKNLPNMWISESDLRIQQRNLKLSKPKVNSNFIRACDVRHIVVNNHLRKSVPYPERFWGSYIPFIGTPLHNSDVNNFAKLPYSKYILPWIFFVFFSACFQNTLYKNTSWGYFLACQNLQKINIWTPFVCF